MHRVTVAASALFFVGLQTSRSVLDGVYSATQADRGRAQYERTCQPCHGGDLRGAVGSALVGDDFVGHWSGLQLDRLFDRVRTMPPDTAERPAGSEALDLVAYILSANGFPAGAKDLDAENMPRIRIERRGSAGEVPNFSLVAIVGCLAASERREWIVTGTSRPMRTTNPDASTDEELARAATTPRGDDSYRLLNPYPSPDKLEGHLVEAKGFLIRGAVNAVNVTALASVATACGR